MRDLARGDRAVLVPNAADSYRPDARERKVARDVVALSAAGFRVAVLDLAELARRRERLPSWVQDADLVWAGAGNTFALLRAMDVSGLSAAAAGMVESGVVWGGDSAGAVVCAQDLRPAAAVDRPLAGSGMVGLGLVDFFPWPHWRPGKPGHEARHQAVPGSAVPVFRLRDGEHLVVTDHDVQLHGLVAPDELEESLFPVQGS